MLTLIPPSKTITKNIFDGSTPHKHILWEVIFFIDGNCNHHIMGKTYKPVNGDVFIVGPNHVHNIELLEEEHCHRDLYFTDEQVRTVCSLFNDEHFYKHICENVVLIHLSNSTLNHIVSELKTIEVYDILAKTSSTEKNKQNLSACVSVTHSILHFLLGTYLLKNLELSQTDQPKWLVDLLYKLNSPNYFAQKPNEIIKNSGYSHSRFAELFKKHVGISLVEYMINKRMSYAADLLSSTDKSTLEISSLVGYDSYSCFVRLFKKQFKISPIQYRQHNTEF